MFGASPFYRTHNPYLHSSYHQPQPQHYPFGYSPYQQPRSVDLDRARSIAAQRARRAQWLPDEYDDDDNYYDAYQLSPHERAYLNAHRNQELMERERRRREQEEAEAEARERALEEQKWQQELDRRQKEDEAARKRMGEERERRRQAQLSHADQREQQRSRARSRSASPTHIPITTPNEPPAPQYDEKHVEAASVLQRHFRIHQSIRTIKSLSAEFDTLRREFTYPSILSFQDSSSSSTDVINIPAVSPSSVTRSNQNENEDDTDPNVKIPKLAFNSTNYSLLAYNDALDKLLVKLDGVESWGEADVRKRRRKVVKQIEKEQAFVDRFWRTSWLKHIETQGEWVDGDMIHEPSS
ncbi:hypothetical protein NP233_g12992 [Leucocoprinus birnbaumii]|uniref:BAG domain-containing protein n=1 Tax=Leucocoprinus birnbaumii TaxID=56174 RepID=A0AAD5VDW3_9AGAR|nr:hypothetical protein NP233_g12992 [Leucocoprinus birnbaumii]